MKIRLLALAVVGCVLVAAEPKPLGPVEARKKVGEKITVEMTVKTAKDRLEKRGEIYLDSQEDFKDEKNFAVVITRDGAASLKKAKITDPTKHFAGKTIRATGTVKEVEGVPRIEIDDAKQITVAEKDKPKSPFERWEKTIAAMEKADKAKPPREGGIFFCGSSSIVKWDLAKSFPDLPVVKRGFGGSQIADSTHFASRSILPYKPATIVFYAGDNDVASGKTPETVRDDFVAFAKVVHEKLPKTKILFLCVKPSVARWKLIDKVRKANDLIAAECKKDERLTYVDVSEGMLDKDGKPKPELFVKDGLHLSADGYALWTAKVKPLITAQK
jgi:lysophospholipase L1-like esterase